MNISLYTHRLKEAIFGKKKLIAANKWLKNATYNWRAGAVILTLRICLQDPTPELPILQWSWGNCLFTRLTKWPRGKWFNNQLRDSGLYLALLSMWQLGMLSRNPATYRCASVYCLHGIYSVQWEALWHGWRGKVPCPWSLCRMRSNFRSH